MRHVRNRGQKQKIDKTYMLKKKQNVFFFKLLIWPPAKCFEFTSPITRAAHMYFKQNLFVLPIKKKKTKL